MNMLVQGKVRGCSDVVPEKVRGCSDVVQGKVRGCSDGGTREGKGLP